MTDQPEAAFGPREAQPADAFLQFALAQGWDFFADKLGGTSPADRQELASELEAEAFRVASDAALIFNTAEGRRVLEWLCDISLRRPMWVLGQPNGEAFAAMREGQNGVVFSLLKLIAAGRRERQPQREGHTT